MSGILAAVATGGFVPITVNCSSIYGFNSGGSTVNCGPADGFASGGSGSFTYLWSYADGATFNVLSPSSPNSIFRALGMAPGEERDAQYTLTATDTVTGQTASITVSVVAQRDF